MFLQILPPATSSDTKLPRSPLPSTSPFSSSATTNATWTGGLPGQLRLPCPHPDQPDPREQPGADPDPKQRPARALRRRVYLWSAALRVGRKQVGYFAAVVKAVLRHIPIFGWAFKLIGFLFLSRSFEARPLLSDDLPECASLLNQAGGPCAHAIHQRRRILNKWACAHLLSASNATWFTAVRFRRLTSRGSRSGPRPSCGTAGSPSG